MADKTTKSIKGNLNRGFGGTIPIKGVLPWLGANFFDGAYGAYDILNNQVLSPLNNLLTGNQQPQYSYRDEYQNRLKGYDLPVYTDGTDVPAAPVAPAAPANVPVATPAAPALTPTRTTPPTAADILAGLTPQAGPTATLQSTSPRTPIQQNGMLPVIPGTAIVPPSAAPSPVQTPASGDYANQQKPTRNAYTMGAPVDDRNASAMAQRAAERFNVAEQSHKSLATPESAAALAEAQAEAGRWSQWASMAPQARKQVLMAGERAALAAQGVDKVTALRNEMDTPGARELLDQAAKFNAGQIDASGKPVSKYGSGQVVGYVPKGTKTAQSGTNDYLNSYDPYDKRVDWSTQPNEAGLTDDQIIKRAGGSASAAAKLADMRAMQRRQYLADLGITSKPKGAADILLTRR